MHFSNVNAYRVASRSTIIIIVTYSAEKYSVLDTVTFKIPEHVRISMEIMAFSNCITNNNDTSVYIESMINCTNKWLVF